MSFPMVDKQTLAEWHKKGLISAKDAGLELNELDKKTDGPSVTSTGATLNKPALKEDGMSEGISTVNTPVLQQNFNPSKYLDEIPKENIVVRVVREGDPKSKLRPIFNSVTKTAFTPKRSKQYEKELAAIASLQVGDATPDALWAYGIRAVFYMKTWHRKDVDNMMKAVFDAMNKLAFKDDVQVEEMMGWKVMDSINPRTEFIVYKMHKIDRESGQCVVCNKKFRRYKSWKARLYCSRKCNTIATTKSVTVNCTHCNKELLRKPSKINEKKTEEFFCSGACIGLHKRRETKCAVCEVHISRPNSHAKEGQVNFYCSKACQHVSRIGKPKNQSPESRSASAKKAWETRRAKKNKE